MLHKNERDENPSSLSRRGFLKSGLSSGLAAAALPALTNMTAAAPFVRQDVIDQGELDEKTIAELQEGMTSGKYTARRLVEIYLSRIDAIDKQGPALRSVLEVNPDALAIADNLDRERKEKGARGPLHGIPVVIKDNIDTADRMLTTAGSLALVGAKPPADAFAVQQLRRAGAVILGKTNLSEWANIRSNRSTSGWSGRGGLTKNPYALNRNTSGSSSGSAVAVTASLCAAAVGTETDGSIVSPSSINGIVGIKPTVGLVSRTGIIPISHTQDTAGPMARTVRDAAILLGALAGVDAEDRATLSGRGKAAADYTVALNPRALTGARIGVVRQYFGFLRAVDTVIGGALDVMKQQGAVLIDPIEIPNLRKFDDSEFTVLLYELKADLNAYLSRLGPQAPVRTLKDIIDFNQKNAAKEMPYFGQESFLKAEEKGPLTTREYTAALKNDIRLTRKEGIDAVMDKYKLDALVAPTDGPAWMTDLVTGDHFIGGSSQLAAVAGYPSVTVPAGFIFGLPVGVSLFGRAWSESRLIGLAYAFEQATRVRKPPSFLPTANLQL
ncbi:amidase [bacterium]|nr:MAG: amidase [bacterium]